MSPVTRGLLAVSLISALPLMAMLLLAIRPSGLREQVGRLAPFAAGALGGAALLHLLPEALRHGSVAEVAWWTMAGMAGFLVVDRLLHSRLGLSPATVTLGGGTLAGVTGHGSRLRDLLPLLVLGDALHNALDGMLVAATYINEPALGLVTGVAVGLHELPRELGTFALMVAAGLSARQAIVFNIGSAVLAMTGAALTLVTGAGTTMATSVLGPVAAGTFMYLAGVLSWHEFRQPASGTTRAWQLGLLAAGAALTAFGIAHH